MSRKQSTKEVLISKVQGQGSDLPAFFPLVHRHFQKSMPNCGTQQATLTVPTDLLGMLIPPSILDQIESIEVTYKAEK